MAGTCLTRAVMQMNLTESRSGHYFSYSILCRTDLSWRRVHLPAPVFWAASLSLVLKWRPSREAEEIYSNSWKTMNRSAPQEKKETADRLVFQAVKERSSELKARG